MHIKYPVCLTIGVIGSIITSLFGGWTSGLITLVSLMVIDFVTGLMVSFVFKKSTKTESGAFSSNIGWKGICKKVLIILFVYIAHRIDIVFVETNVIQTAYLANATIIGFAVNEFGSIIENAGLMGLKLPAPIQKAFDILNKKINSDNGESSDENKAA